MTEPKKAKCESALYALRDPRNRVIRYVGYSKDPWNRYRGHMQDAQKSIATHKCFWIRSLLSLNLRPLLTLLCIVESSEEAQRLEIAFIARLRQQGIDLTNGTDGGDGGRQDEATRLKMRLAKLGTKQKAEHVDARREKHRVGAFRRFEDPVQREKQAAITRAQWADPMARAKKSQALKAAWARRKETLTAEQLSDIGRKMIAHLTPEQRKQNGSKAGLVSKQKRALRDRSQSDV